MTENVLGEFQCVDDGCQSSFTITASVVSEAYEDWEPVCPVCGTRNEIQQVGRPENTA